MEPLLERIANNNKTVAVPLADTISHDTFEFQPVDVTNLMIGGFDFDLNFNWRPLSKEQIKSRKNVIEPVRYARHDLIDCEYCEIYASDVIFIN